MSATPSRFIRHDLMSTDAPAAARFYGELFGWKTTDVSIMGSTVVRLSLGERVLGAVMPFNMGPAYPSHWVPYVQVESVEECCRRISALGGDVCIGATEIPPGRFAVVNDPQKAIFSPFTPKVAPPAVPEASPRAGDFCWDELLTSDVAGATTFYTSLFGWGTSEMDMGSAGTYTILKLGETGIAGVMKMRADAKHRPMWLSYVAVDDVDATAGRAAKLGGTIAVPALDVPGVGRSAVIHDATGASLGIFRGRS
jgi:predicted enzyme related to lactoylglutathione lyase